MRPEYDFTGATRGATVARYRRGRTIRLISARRATRRERDQKRQVTIRLDQATVVYFKQLATEAGIPYHTLINLYLRDCASSGRRLAMSWRRSVEESVCNLLRFSARPKRGSRWLSTQRRGADRVP